ncbi:FadR/GntR family transcriptional regulator [Salsuginibacillus kocurii]|uniref:FadR/GntR family transcriptional regulator n=1 Tax=Salsuginibacillus kocurii TaxID=427078 RepID=UPI00037C44F2|nr:FadR/GntR family transcriptional regulator [Salsuginibacillus kocurii]
MIERKKVSQQVLAAIKEKIRAGEFPAEEKLPSETELAELFGVSRSPVREALSVLAASGIIDSKQGGGSWVRATHIEDFLQKNGLEVLSPGEVIHLIETRIILETEAAQLAAQRRNQEDIEDLQAQQDELELILEQNDMIGDDIDFKFHHAIVKASHNPILLKTMENISDLYNEAMKASLNLNREIHGKKQQIYKEHGEILEAIRKQQPDQAANALRLHLNNSREKLESKLEEFTALNTK